MSEYLPDRYELAQNLSRVEIEGWEHPSHAGLLRPSSPLVFLFLFVMFTFVRKPPGRRLGIRNAALRSLSPVVLATASSLLLFCG